MDPEYITIHGRYFANISHDRDNLRRLVQAIKISIENAGYYQSNEDPLRDIQFSMDFLPLSFHPSYYQEKDEKFTLSGLLRKKSQKPTFSSDLNSIRDDFPFDITISLVPIKEEESGYFVDITIKPAYYRKITQLQATTKNLRSQKVDFINKSSIDLAKAIGASIVGKEIEPPMPLKVIKKGYEHVPLEITHSLEEFEKDYPEDTKTAFIMMKIEESDENKEILKTICGELEKHNIRCLRADLKEYHSQLYYNVLTYVYGCDFGIAIFQQHETIEFNPNVALEVGCMIALQKEVCILKEKGLASLPTDIIGSHYRSFDRFDIKNSISKNITQWISDARSKILE